MEINEAINLLIDVLCIPLLILAIRKSSYSHSLLLSLPVVFILLSHVFTIVESFVFPAVFNVLEHLMFLTGVLALFVIIVWPDAFRTGDDD